MLLFVPKYGIMSLLLRDKLTTKPPHWKLNESISDAGREVRVLQPEASHTARAQSIHTASSLRYHSHSPTKTRLWALSGTRGARTATLPLPPPALPPSTCWFTPGSASISIAWIEAASEGCSGKMLVGSNSVQVQEELPSGLNRAEVGPTTQTTSSTSPTAPTGKQ